MAPEAPPEDEAVKQTLKAHGAPFLAYKAAKRMPLETALLKALRLAKRDASLLKVLPVVVAKNAQTLNWVGLKEDARREKLKAEPGMLVELTADFAQRPELKERVRDLMDRRRSAHLSSPNLATSTNGSSRKPPRRPPPASGTYS